MLGVKHLPCRGQGYSCGNYITYLLFLAGLLSRMKPSCCGTWDAGYVGHTAVTYLNCVSFEYLVELGSFGKVFVDELKERFADVGSDVLAVRKVKPNHVALPVSRLLRSVFCV